MPKLKGFGLGDGEKMMEAKNEFSDVVVPKGVYKAKVKRMTHAVIKKEGPNKGKSRFSILLEIVKTPKLPEKYVGAGVWTGLNVIESGAGLCNDFVNALAGPETARQKALRRAFWTPDIAIDNDGNVLRIGKKKIGSPNGEIVVTIKTKMGKDQQGNARSEVGSFLIPKSEEEEDDDELNEDDVEEDDDLIDDEDEEDEDVDEDDDSDDVDDDEDDDSDDDDSDEDDADNEDDESDEDEDEDDEEDDNEAGDELREELDGLSLVALRKRAKASAGLKSTTGLEKEDLIEKIMDAELAADDDGEGEDEDDEDEPF